MTRNFCFLCILILPPLIISLFGARVEDLLQYDRANILSGELWRMATCHFTHTNGYHLFLNVTGALLIYTLFGKLCPFPLWAVSIAGCIITISTGFLLFHPELAWYRGLSGVLHGLLAVGLLGGIKKGNKIYSIGLLALAGKIISELTIGSPLKTELSIGAPVISEAHLYGAVTGSLIFFIFWGVVKYKYLIHPKSILFSLQKNLQ